MADTNLTQGGAAGHTPEPQNDKVEQSRSPGQTSVARTEERTVRADQGRLQGSQSAQPGQEAEHRQSGAMQERGQRGLARYGRDPFAMMQRLSEEMDDLFDSFFHGRPMARPTGRAQVPSLWAPEVELCEQGNQLRVCVDLPGVSKDNVKIDIQDGMLTIEGERREERTEGGEQQGFRRSERRYGSFYRSIPLPEGADAEQAQARMKDGVLEITLPMTPPKKGRRLEIQG